MACPNLTAAINSYNATLTHPISNSILNIAMAGGIYYTIKDNYNLDLLYLNVTIGRSPFTQGDVIIDYYTPYPVIRLKLFSLENYFSPICGSPTNITLNNLILTNGSEVFESMVNNVNIVLNNVTIRDFKVEFDAISVLDAVHDKCNDSSNQATMTINGGGIYNCTGGKYSQLLKTSCDFTMVGSTFTGNNNHLFILNVSPSRIYSTRTMIANSSFTNNTAAMSSMVNIIGDQSTITNTLFAGNSNTTGLVYLSVLNATITGTTFTNNTITYGKTLRVYDSNMTMDNCTFSDNIAQKEIYTASSNVTLSNIVFGQVDGLSGGAIGCQEGSITLNDIDNRIGRDLYDCDLESQCSRLGNHQVCLKKKLSDGAIAGIVIGSVAGAILIIGISVLAAKRIKKKNQSNSIPL
eukprot:gene21600-25940_t